MRTHDDIDPFLPDADDPDYEITPEGNSRLKVEATTKRQGFQRHESKPISVNAWELAAYGDAEHGQGRRKRAKPVSHDKRTRAFLESQGYGVVKLERMVVGRSGVAFKADYLGLWDFEGNKAGHPRLLVQVCGKSGLNDHRRKLCSDEKAWDNKRPRIENLRFCLSQGWCCVLIAWEKQDNGRYLPHYEVVTDRTIEAVLGRRRKAS